MLTRGIKDKVDRFISDLQAQYFTYGKKLENGQPRRVQLAVRPLQIWELVFPKEHLKTMLATIEAPEEEDPRFKWVFRTLRKLFGAKEAPKVDLKTEPRRIVYKFCVGTYPIGIKEDGVWGKGAPEGFEGEEAL